MIGVKQKYGPWAIVTGASSGIGKEFANQLAASGVNVVLVARRGLLLEELAESLQSRYRVEVRFASLDLSQPTFLAQLELITKGLEIGLVISNAGGARMGAFDKIPVSDFEAMIHLNVMAQMKISHWFTARLIKEKRKGGLILVSSTTAFQGVPYCADYSAAKAYILNLGEALHYEFKHRGIDITVLVPGPTDAPGLTDNADADMMAHLPMKPQPAAGLVKEGLSALMKNKPTHIGGRMNRIMTSIMKIMMTRYAASVFWGKMMYKMVTLK